MNRHPVVSTTTTSLLQHSAHYRVKHVPSFLSGTGRSSLPLRTFEQVRPFECAVSNVLWHARYNSSASSPRPPTAPRSCLSLLIEMSGGAIELAPNSLGAPIHDINSAPDNSTYRQAGDVPTGLEDEQRSLREDPPVPASVWKTAGIIASVTCFTVMNSYLAGVVVVSTPILATDLRLGAGLMLWYESCLLILQMRDIQLTESPHRPASIYSLTCGCTLLLLGSVADVVGSRLMYLLGCLLQCTFTLACGLSQTGVQLIVFRGFSGIAASFCLPSTVSIVNNAFPPGRLRSSTFASMGGGLNFGFGLGLVLGGVFSDTIGWRWGFYLAAILNLIILVSAAWVLPKSQGEDSPTTWKRFALTIDWVGAVIASSSLALLSYVLA